MKRFTLILALVVIFVFISSPCHAQEWAITYGGSGVDWADSIQQTLDGGYIVAGGTSSFGVSSSDMWVLKLDADGAVAWQKTYGRGGMYTHWAKTIQQTSDGGYVVASGAGYWVLKLNSDGSTAWQKSYGGGRSDSIRQTFDEGGNPDGYALAGSTPSFGAGEDDIWVLRLDLDGNIVWQKTYGGTDYDAAHSIQQTADGGYVVAGATHSFGGDSSDMWVLKLNSDGSIAWQKAYDNGYYEAAKSILQTPDGGYIVVGGTTSCGEPCLDLLALKLSSEGSVEWQKTYGGNNQDEPRSNSIQLTTDGGYVLTAWTIVGAGSQDFWVLKLNSDGSIAWQKTYGGSGNEGANSIQQTTDGRYVVAGSTPSFGAGEDDIWVLKLNANGEIPGCSAIGTSNATVTDTSALVQDTSITPQNTSVTPDDTSVTPDDTSAETSLVCPEPVIDKLKPHSCPRGEKIRLIGVNFGDVQGDGEVRIGKRKHYDDSALGKGKHLHKVKLWSPTKIKVVLSKGVVPEKWEGTKKYVWIEKNGVKSNYKKVTILPPSP